MSTLFSASDTALVTGAANGIGKAIARALVGEGVPTVFADANAQLLHEATRDLGEKAIVWCGDLSQAEECDRLFADGIRALGGVSLFVHSASPRRNEKDHLFGVDAQTWRNMLAVNVDCGFLLGRQLARHMIDRKLQGSMLFVTSLHAHTPRNLPHYSAAKAGLEMLVKEFARALGAHGIRVNALVPGAISAGGVVLDAAVTKHIPLGRIGVPQDIAPMALAVLSQRYGGYMTGTSVAVDGGIALTNWFEPPQLS